MRPHVSEIAAYSSRYLSKLVQSRLSFIFISQIRIFKSKNTHTRNFCSRNGAVFDIEVTYTLKEPERIRTLTEIYNTV